VRLRFEMFLVFAASMAWARCEIRNHQRSADAEIASTKRAEP
jgi:hypothetical protein